MTAHRFIQYAVASKSKPATVYLQCRVKPNASKVREGITSLTDDAIEVCVSAVPRNGESNKAVLAVLSEVGLQPLSRLLAVRWVVVGRRAVLIQLVLANAGTRCRQVGPPDHPRRQVQGQGRRPGRQVRAGRRGRVSGPAARAPWRGGCEERRRLILRCLRTFPVMDVPQWGVSCNLLSMRGEIKHRHDLMARAEGVEGRAPQSSPAWASKTLLLWCTVMVATAARYMLVCIHRRPTRGGTVFSAFARRSEGPCQGMAQRED